MAVVEAPKRALEVPESVFLTRLEAVVNWCRKNSLWPMPFATACCGIELMAVGASRHDLARFGAEVMRFSPRQCDLMIVAGRVAMKMLPVLQRIWLQMPEPKWCISMGACAASGGVFDTYAVVQGMDRFLPTDVYIPGCPPRPEQILQAVMELQAKITERGTFAGPLSEVDTTQKMEINRKGSVEAYRESRFGFGPPSEHGVTQLGQGPWAAGRAAGTDDVKGGPPRGQGPASSPESVSGRPEELVR